MAVAILSPSAFLLGYRLRFSHHQRSITTSAATSAASTMRRATGGSPVGSRGAVDATDANPMDSVDIIAAMLPPPSCSTGLQSRHASSGTASRPVPRGLLESNRRAELVLLESFSAVGTIAAAGLAWLLVSTAVDARLHG